MEARTSRTWDSSRLSAVSALPSTIDRVPNHTRPELNARIRHEMSMRVERVAASGPEAIAERLEELNREWDIERALETNAAGVSAMGLALGLTVDRRFLAIPAAVAGFLLQHALFGYCPPVNFFRRLGFRTSHEIEEERYALKALRGDFSEINPSRESPLARLHQVFQAVSR